MEANCLAVWKIGDLQAVDIYQYTISFMFEDKTKHQTWLLILNILRQTLALSFREFVYFVRALLWTVNHINYMFMHNKAEK